MKLQEMGIDAGILLRDILRELKKKKQEEIDMNQVLAGVCQISKRNNDRGKREN